MVKYVRSVTEQYVPPDVAAAGEMDYDEDEPVKRSPRGRGRVVEGGEAEQGTSSGTDSEGEASGREESGGALRAYKEPPVRRRGLRNLLEAAGYGEAAAGAPDVDILNLVTCNSDRGGEGSLFVCAPDEESGADGHEWADEAVDLGAVAVVADRPLPGCLLPVVVLPDLPRALGRLADEFYDHPCARMRTVAFVGSYGKTTASWLVRGLLEDSGELVAIVGNIEQAVGMDRLTREGDVWAAEEEDPTLERSCAAPFHSAPYRGKYELPGTTPDALALHKILAGAADRGAGAALVEVCPGLAADARAEALRPEVLVFTNVAPERAGADPGGVDAYVERVAAMFERLQPDQTAVINLDDPNGSMLARLAAATGAQVLTYGHGGGADIVAERVKYTVWQTEMLVRTPVGKLEIIQLQVGRFNVANVLASVGVGLALGVKLLSIVTGIEAVDIVPGRCELVDEEQPFPVVVDAAATPEQLSRLVDDIKEAGARRVLLVLGCPGSSTREQRAAIGSMAHFKSDVVFLTNDSPGVELPDEIISDIVAGFPDDVLARHAGSYYNWLQDPHRVPPWFQRWLLRYQSEAGRYIVEDRFSAIRVAIGMAKARDVVVVAGRGHLDFVEYWDGVSAAPGTGGATRTVRAWLDDRVECRNAVSRLDQLYKIKDLDRNAMPWTRYPEEREWLVPPAGLAGDAAAGGSAQYMEQYLRDAAKAGPAAGEEDDEEEEDVEEEDGEF